jgi:hypothetical protein
MDLLEKSFEYAAETTKQVLTLSSGIIAVTVTFTHDITEPGSRATPLIAGAWLCFAIALFLGVLSFMAMTGLISRAVRYKTQPDLYARNLRIFASLQIAVFAIGIAMTVTFGVVALYERDARAKRQPPAKAVPAHAGTARSG